ncbi:MAG: hypothetical protein EZS28_054870, partial [Streblomastix strix]
MQGLTTIVAAVYASIEAVELTAGEVADVVESVASAAVLVESVVKKLEFRIGEGELSYYENCIGSNA